MKLIIEPLVIFVIFFFLGLTAVMLFTAAKQPDNTVNNVQHTPVVDLPEEWQAIKSEDTLIARIKGDTIQLSFR